jgi:hypothetical protein
MLELANLGGSVQYLLITDQAKDFVSVSGFTKSDSHNVTQKYMSVTFRKIELIQRKKTIIFHECKREIL